MNFILKSLESIKHCLFENALIANRLHKLGKAFGKSEGYELRDRKFPACAKTIAKIDHNDIKRGCMNQEVIQMSVTNAQDITNNTNNCIIGNKLILYM